jgi:hypothetical protein
MIGITTDKYVLYAFDCTIYSITKNPQKSIQMILPTYTHSDLTRALMMKCSIPITAKTEIPATANNRFVSICVPSLGGMEYGNISLRRAYFIRTACPRVIRHDARHMVRRKKRREHGLLMCYRKYMRQGTDIMPYGAL